jgi:Na+-transporting methylmalonyl-CoA/oxaloacetate decarboxylase gamma subunit
MKTILMMVLLACALFGGACSRSKKQPDTALQPTPAANASLKADAERLRQVTAKAAAERKRAQAPESPTPSAPHS